ncbi:hypothetical protein OGAPHI_001694 [Ogataea philodendri]|uniref:Dipeptidase n=1 Tax=Ogataea philodendri TaxID=1378263 RepID=A0A9P8T798_9ASCO|nr:uncharacterized protein OGAPHI_001694 [Ogataea philodendri]KAH3667940.1 hypothetical protein OGAPHI_001694 [Ogataea philodendri]
MSDLGNIARYKQHLDEKKSSVRIDTSFVDMVEDLQIKFKDLLKAVPVVDTHNDLPYLVRLQLHLDLDDEKFDLDSPLIGQTDLLRLKEGGVGLQFFSCWIEPPNPDELYQDFDTANSVVRDTLEQVDIVKRIIRKYPNKMTFVTKADDALKEYLSTGKISIALGVEGLHQVDTSLAVLRQYHELGVRYVTLTHNCDNPFATGCTTVIAGKEDKGLTDYGRRAIKEFNRLGMMVDLSHVSHQTMIDTLDITKAPVIFSHSSAYSVTGHLRNVKDDVLQMVKENGGVVCVTFVPGFVQKPGAKEATIDDCVDHILHIVNLIGWDHVGLGSDFDGMASTGPKGLTDVSKYPDLIVKVWQKTNATENDIKKIMGLNVLRVWEQCELVAESMENEDPVGDTWEGRNWSFPEWCTRCSVLYPGSDKKNAHKHTIYSTQRFNFPNETLP